MTLVIIRFISVILLVFGIYGVILSNSRITKYKEGKDRLLRGFYGVNIEPSINNANRLISKYLRLLMLSTINIGIQLTFLLTQL